MDRSIPYKLFWSSWIFRKINKLDIYYTETTVNHIGYLEPDKIKDQDPPHQEIILQAKSPKP